MTDLSESIFQTQSKRLGELFDLDTSSLTGWLDEDFKVILLHQLSTPIHLDWENVRPDMAEKLRSYTGSSPEHPACYGDLFLCPQPPVELLILVKEFAKAHYVHPLSPLPREITRALYYLSIASALAHGGQSISKLNQDDLRAGFAWVLDQAWINDAMRKVVRQALQNLQSSQDG